MNFDKESKSDFLGRGEGESGGGGGGGGEGGFRAPSFAPNFY